MADKELDLDGISASLDELVKAADATDVVSKAYGGVNLESYGHVDERGKTSGGYADTGDVGGLDDMMIGKMAQVLIDGGFSADQISAFMGQDEDEEDDEDDMEGKASFAPHTRPSAKMHGKGAGDINVRSGGAGSPTNPGTPPPPIGQPKPVPTGKYTKSMDQFRQDQDIADAVDISPFLEALTTRTADQLDAIRKGMGEAHGEQTGVNRAMAGAVYQIGRLQKSMAEIVGALDKRLNLVERQPAAGQKGVTSMSKALTKAMPGEVGTDSAQLNKSEIIATLSYMNLEKGMKEINGRNTRELVGMFESGNQLAPDTLDAVQKFIATHPAEAKLARTYR